jgi:hypothetical protein
MVSYRFTFAKKQALHPMLEKLVIIVQHVENSYDLRQPIAESVEFPENVVFRELKWLLIGKDGYVLEMSISVVVDSIQHDAADDFFPREISVLRPDGFLPLAGDVVLAGFDHLIGYLNWNR